MRVAICDDDAAMREHYAELIKLVAEGHGKTVEVEQFKTGEQLLFSLADKKTPPDIAFLDIFMPGVDGIDLGTQMRKSGFIGSIIYLTRSKDHMLPAFDVGATNYVIKGDEYGSDRFERVFLKAAAQAEQRKRKYILLNGISEHRNIAIESIRYFEVNRHICVVHYGYDESFEFVSTLGKAENMLLPYGFVRVHKSFLVNCAAVRGYNFKRIVLEDGTEVPIGRKYQDNFRQAMNSFADVGLEDVQSGKAEGRAENA